MEIEERGWDAPDKFVCVDCVEDGFLRDRIQSNVTALVCDYCGRQSHELIAASVETIMQPIGSSFFEYFAAPGEAGLPGDSDWSLWLTETDDALSSLPLFCHDDLFIDIKNSFRNSDWVPCVGGHWHGTHASTIWKWGWEHFERTVKTRTRYFFASAGLKKADYDNEDYSPSDLLNRIGCIAQELGLYQKLEAGTSLYRVREMRDTDKLDTFSQLGPPPSSKASAGRMNPAGIGYLYLAREQRTAIGEVLKHPPCQAAIATFSPNNDLTILDLTELPEAPSVFDVDNYNIREAILFLEEFVEAISKPIAKNGREHVDYVPSQVVSEFFSQVFASEKLNQIDGMIYPSSVVPNGQNVVIFPPRESIEDKDWEKLVEMTEVKQFAVENWEEFSELISP